MAPPDPQARRQAILHLPAYLPGFPKEISERAKTTQGLLSADITNDSGIQNLTPKEIYNVAFNESSQHDQALDVTCYATPKRYRLLDCTEIVSNRTLRILEFIDFPCVQYAALSYVWRGNPPTNDCIPNGHEFSVPGALDADPISLDVLFDACKASLACGAPYLWLDRLCMMQTSKQDKRWQILEMYRIYTFATVCIVAPGGLRRLVSLNEETQWIHRGWTLQEVVAPHSVAVLFAWTHTAGEGHVRVKGENNYARIEVVTPGRSAMMGLDPILGFCSVGCLDFKPDGADKVARPMVIEAVLFGKPAMNVDNITPNIAALSFATARNLDTDEMRDFCIWQCALVRTSSRPVDLVFSIMGVLGVLLDPSDFAVDDRLGATIALAREILRQGRSASWLGLSMNLPPCPHLSTFPIFPRTTVAGRATYDLPSGDQQIVTLTEAIYPNDVGLFPPLKGSMEETGYHSFNALAVQIAPASMSTLLSANSPYDDKLCPTILRAVDRSVWVTHHSTVISSKPVCVGASATKQLPSFAAMLGFYNGIPAETNGNNIRALLLTEHANNRFHVRSYFLLSHESLKWAANLEPHHFCVGGPEVYPPATIR